MSFHRGLVLISVIAVTLALKKSGAEVPSQDDAGVVQVHAIESRCKIVQDTPLGKVYFSFTVTPEEGVVHTGLWDVNKKKVYVLDHMRLEMNPTRFQRQEILGF
ncbi:hypothetical protein FOZ60_007578 [Perkinsus olseni]|uniref:Uncharacterized protein n=1 Tax=Perkinsus olseni TaxID=32597 RepID=A0A7J6PGJ4_PEROL|nr:hypothetical protein FOZ60_007578 [Perkinsus olseni]KAF4748802.1 hypothetical protein FOZ62_031090 [Perkinsus olseni]